MSANDVSGAEFDGLFAPPRNGSAPPWTGTNIVNRRRIAGVEVHKLGVLLTQKFCTWSLIGTKKSSSSGSGHKRNRRAIGKRLGDREGRGQRDDPRMPPQDTTTSIGALLRLASLR